MIAEERPALLPESKGQSHAEIPVQSNVSLDLLHVVNSFKRDLPGLHRARTMRFSEDHSQR